MSDERDILLRKSVLRTIRTLDRHGPTTTTTLMRHTGLTRQRTLDLLHDLWDINIVDADPSVPELWHGRRVTWTLNTSNWNQFLDDLKIGRCPHGQAAEGAHLTPVEDTVVSATEIYVNLTELITRTEHGERIGIKTAHGVVATMIGPDDLDRLRRT